ncbi:hypothetical protein NC652_013938 [Populus alba x Populus x berolinensis]|nr:hypothetical protein NC652_013938 [Populus alba x Populus x berolinensis]
MVQVHIINIFSVMIGIGILIHLSETRGLTSGELQETVEAIHYHITTQFWDLIGLEQQPYTEAEIKRLPRQSSKR